MVWKILSSFCVAFHLYYGYLKSSLSSFPWYSIWIQSSMATLLHAQYVKASSRLIVLTYVYRIMLSLLSNNTGGIMWFTLIMSHHLLQTWHESNNLLPRRECISKYDEQLPYYFHSILFKIASHPFLFNQWKCVKMVTTSTSLVNVRIA